MRKLRVLLLDDEARLTMEIKEFLENTGNVVFTADRPSLALDLVKSEHMDIALIDIKLPEYDGLTFLKRVLDIQPKIEAIVMSGHGDMDSVIEALRLGAFDYLRKPFSSVELQASITRTDRFLEAKDSARRYALLCGELNKELIGSEDLIGNSPALEAVRDAISRAAAHPATPVLIQGESGTGKELVARRIHSLSGRASGRFVAVNCAAIPREMFETEFFGHARGAFTGARTERSGLFRTADGGTLFLDEVGEIPLDLQAKLLRVLENGVVRPVGADVELSVDTRVLCATNRNLLHEVRAGRFRKDLFYRLAVIEIPVPPLRDRREDIEALADLFYSRFLINSGTASRPLSRDLVRRLSSYSFPGNVRELKNLVERISILGRDPTDKELHLWMEPDGVDGLSINVYAESQKDGGTLNLESRERWAVQKALAESEGVQTAAARLLGISRQALERRIKRYDLSLQ